MRLKKLITPTVLISIVAIAASSLTIGRQIYLQRQPDIISFSLIHFAGYLFFLLMPVEILFAYYLVESFNVPLLYVVAVITAIVAQIIDYAIGHFFSDHVIHKMIGVKRYNKTKNYMDKYGNLTVFVFNLFPLSSSVLSAVAGILRYNFRNFVIYSLAGLSIKYLVIIFLFG